MMSRNITNTPLSKQRISKQLVIQQMIAHYVNKDNPETYLNGTKSLLAVKPHLTYKSAGAIASEYLADPKIRESVAQMLEDMGMGDKVRLSALKDEINRLSDKVTQTHYTVDPETGKRRISHVVETEAPNKSRLKALDLAWKVTGQYDKNRAVGKAYGKEVSDLIKRFRPGNGKSAKGGGGERTPAARKEEASSHTDNKNSQGAPLKETEDAETA
jgi:hypothetical protein